MTFYFLKKSIKQDFNHPILRACLNKKKDSCILKKC